LYGRLAALPDAAEPLQRSQLLAASSLGTWLDEAAFAWLSVITAAAVAGQGASAPRAE
jgi:hypothetical protein